MTRLAKQIEAELLNENPERRAKGLRPAIIWVPDSSAPGFGTTLRRQIEAIKNSPDNAAALSLIDQAGLDLFSD